MNKEEIITLRAHHGMCFKFFRGEGYSDDFTKNMSQIKRILESENPIIKVVSHGDIVCDKCPNLVDAACKSYEKVNRYDGGVLDACGIKAGTTMDYDSFSKLVTKNVIEAGKRESICGDCQWTDICK